MHYKLEKQSKRLSEYRFLQYFAVDCSEKIARNQIVPSVHTQQKLSIYKQLIELLKMHLSPTEKMTLGNGQNFASENIYFNYQLTFMKNIHQKFPES